jgi:DNA mismatch repair ATPase MutS
MKELPVARNYFDIEINDNDEIVRDFKVKQGVSKKHLALKLLKKKGFNQNIIHDAEYLYEQLQGKQSQ